MHARIGQAACRTMASVASIHVQLGHFGIIHRSSEAGTGKRFIHTIDARTYADIFRARAGWVCWGTPATNLVAGGDEFRRQIGLAHKDPKPHHGS